MRIHFHRNLRNSLLSKMASLSSYSIDVGGTRVQYKQRNELLLEERLESKNPFKLFKIWYEIACSTPEILEANAMCVATATKEGIPSVRPVLLKNYSSEGFKFFTNYNSRKGRELAENPHAALLFYWEPLKRCIRIEGTVEKVSADASQEYFQSRPKDSQIGAWCSHQSQVIPSRDVLLEKEQELRKKFTNLEVLPKPEEWGGYLVIPKSFEFWQGQSDRLHDRILFRRPKNNEKPDEEVLREGENGWVYERLSP